jgi:electron transfer flavoprotein alpha subunit
MIEVNRRGEVWVFAEQERGGLSEVPLELLGKGRELADTLGVPLAAVLLAGHGGEEMATRLGQYGADKVYLVENDLLAEYQTATYARVICELVQANAPQVVLYGASTLGRDLAPTVASALRCGLTADCTDLQIGDHTPPGRKELHKNLLLQIRPAFGGSIHRDDRQLTIAGQMATVREGVMVMPQPDGRRGTTVVRPPASFNGFRPPLRILESERREKRVNLKAARVIVAGGAGVGTRENFRLIWELANCLGGAVGASRAAIDLGFVDKDNKVGQTGTTVRPALYIACGISGSVQHRAGMEESAKILAINTDRSAPIFSVAHYGIVGDLRVVIPKLVRAIRGGARMEVCRSPRRTAHLARGCGRLRGSDGQLLPGQRGHPVSVRARTCGGWPRS